MTTESERTYTYREPLTGAWSLYPDAGDDSCDNGLLFSAHAFHLGLIHSEHFGEIADHYALVPGVYCRHPNRPTDLVAQDDLIGISSVSGWRAAKIYEYGRRNKWKWKDRALWRLPLFIPTITAAAGFKLSPLLKFSAAMSYLWNLTEGRSKTSGKLLLWLSSKSLGPTWYVRLWKWRMRKLYGPNALEQIMRIYFPAGHPFPIAAKGLDL